MTRIVLVFLAGTVAIAFAAIFVRLALPAPPVVTGFYRMLFASTVLLAVVGLGRRPGTVSWAALARAALAGACFGTDIAIFNTAITKTSVANATLLVNTTPLHIGLWTALVLREGLPWRFVCGAALAIGGAALLLGIEFDGPRGALGELLALGAAFFYAGYLLLIQNARRAAEALPAVLAASLAATIVLGVYTRILGDPLTGFPAHSWAAMVGAAVVAQLGGVMAIVWALRFLPATFASVGLLGQPIGTALLGWLVLGETIDPLQALGGIAVLAGIALASGGLAAQAPAPPATHAPAAS
jgi:drug/metabolite transporter (DMT)-like permease